MKAIVFQNYGPADVLQLKEVEKPVPKENEVLIRIHAAGVNATDPISRQGTPLIARAGNGFIKPTNPILGTALAGVVEAVGKNVKLFSVGDEVYGSTRTSLGAHAEYKCLPENGALASKPKNLTFEEAAAVPYGVLTALPFLRDHGKIRRGHRVLIIGASGSVGSFAVQLAKNFGAIVTGVCSADNFDLVKSLGADDVIDYNAEDFTKSGQTYDIIFDAAGKSTYQACKQSLTQSGIYLLTVPTLAIMFDMLWTARTGTKKAVFAATGLRKPTDMAKDLYFIKERIEAGTIKSVIDRSYHIAQTAEAHKYVEKGHKKGSVVITLDQKN